MKSVAFFVFVCVIAANAGWSQLTCNGGQACQIQFRQMSFSGTDWHATIQNNGPAEHEGQVHLQTQGYGCVLFFCSWVDGPEANNETCDFGSGVCNGGVFVGANEQKQITVPFLDFLVMAQDTSGCCSTDPSSSCNLGGVATFYRQGTNTELSRINMKFFCNLNTRPPSNCRIPTLSVGEDNEFVITSQ